jgi:hypothetical protein
VLTNAPRFSAYVASKAALDAWTLRRQRVRRPGHQLHHHQHAAGAHAHDRAHQLYNNVPTLSPEGGRHGGREACIAKPVRIATRLGIPARCCMRWRRAGRS